MLLRVLVCCWLMAGALPRPMAQGRIREKTGSTPGGVSAVLKRVLPSVVGIWHGDGMLTGTIISRDGLVVTCAHIPAKVGEAVEISLQDGRRLPGKVLSKLPKEGENRRGKDIALVQITASGALPAVSVGTSAGLTMQSPVLAAGFPDTLLYGSDRAKDPLYVRLGYPIASPYQTDAQELHTSIYGAGGDSGGPLFDLRGNLIGICTGGDASGAHIRYTRIDALRSGWKALAGNRPSPPLSPASPVLPSIAAMSVAGKRVPVASEIRSAVVEVRSQERWIGFGCVVGDGLILTKASELGPDLRVVLNNDHVGLAGVVATDPAHDLALLELTYAPELTQHITPIQWQPLSDLPTGTPVAVATPAAFTPLSGITCFRARGVPPIEGTIPCGTKSVAGGVEITEIWDAFFQFRLRRPFFPLRVGDIITQVEGCPTPNRETYVKSVLEARTLGTHPRVSGEPIQVTYLRNGKNVTQTVSLEYSATPSTQLVRPASLRYSGFPSAIACDLPARPEHCGAPVVDNRGRVIGLLIARAPFIESLFLPSADVAAALDQMKRTLNPKK